MRENNRNWDNCQPIVGLCNKSTTAPLMSWLRRRTGPDIKGWRFMAINDACGWRRAMAYIGSSRDGLATVADLVGFSG